jgi:hypothetical protein
VPRVVGEGMLDFESLSPFDGAGFGVDNALHELCAFIAQTGIVAFCQRVAENVVILLQLVEFGLLHTNMPLAVCTVLQTVVKSHSQRAELNLACTH